MALPARLSQNRPRGLFGASTSAPQQPPVSAMDGGINDPAAAPKKGFDWRKALGVLGDSLSIAGGGQPVYVPNLIDQRNRQQAMDYAEQQYQRRQQGEFANQKALIDYRASNREPTSFEQILDAAGIQGDERVGLLRRKAENDAAGVPVGIDVQNPDGSVTRQYVRPGTLGGGQSGPAVGAVEDGFRFKGGNPADKNNWEPVSSGAPSIGGAPPPPNVVPKASYNAIVQSLGSKAEADAFLRRNGLTVGNF